MNSPFAPQDPFDPRADKTMRSEIQFITKPIAERWLEHNVEPQRGVVGTNRKSSPQAIVEYAAAMLQGEWQITHQGIAFDTSGNLVDGAHRLKALVLAAKMCEEQKKPALVIAMMVTYNLPSAAVEALDIGRRRRASDFLAMGGEVSVRTLAAITRLTFHYYHSRPYSTLKVWQTRPWSPDMQSKFLAEHPGLRQAVHWGKSANKVINENAAGSGWYICSTARPDVDMDLFMSQLIYGKNIDDGNAVWFLRELIRNSRMTNRRFDPSQQLGLFIKTFNHWLEGSVPGQGLRFRAGARMPDPAAAGTGSAVEDD